MNNGAYAAVRTDGTGEEAERTARQSARKDTEARKRSEQIIEYYSRRGRNEKV